MAYATSHDLQEPLRKIAGFTELLASKYSGQLDEKADTYVAYIVDGVNRMHILINDILAYSRVTSGSGAFAETDCNALLGNALNDLEFTINESGAVITFDLLPTVWADAHQLRHVLLNLIGNSIKYRGEEPPRVHVSAARKGDEWLFSVKDNGIGIAPEFHDRIFVIFQRLHTRSEYSGTGIGLTICKKIVERHGGRIRVESEAGKGATFFFTIPAGRISGDSDQNLTPN